MPSCPGSAFGHESWTWGAARASALVRFRERRRGEPDAQGLADQVQREIHVWRRYSDWHRYEFFVMRAR